ncbi:unnamed protein product [Lampetra planeri]
MWGEVEVGNELLMSGAARAPLYSMGNRPWRECIAEGYATFPSSGSSVRLDEEEVTEEKEVMEERPRRRRRKSRTRSPAIAAGGNENHVGNSRGPGVVVATVAVMMLAIRRSSLSSRLSFKDEQPVTCADSSSSKWLHVIIATSGNLSSQPKMIRTRVDSGCGEGGGGQHRRNRENDPREHHKTEHADSTYTTDLLRIVASQQQQQQ